MNAVDQPAGPRTAPRFLAKRQKLIDAAVGILNRDGVRGMTFAAVGAKLDLPSNGVNYYFRRKEDLAVACFTQALEVLRDLIARAGQEADPRTRIAAFWRLYVDLRRQVAAGERADLALLDHARGLGEPHRTAIQDGLGILLLEITQTITTDAGRMRPDTGDRDSRSAAQALVLLVQAFWANAWLPRYDPPDMPRAGRWADDILARGLGSGHRAIIVDQPIDLGRLDMADPDPGRNALLVAATLEINEHGYHGASVDRIAARASLTKGAFYHHHEAKDDVVVSCFRRTLSVIRQIQDAACASRPDGWTRLCTAAEALTRLDWSGTGGLLRMSAATALPDTLRRPLLDEWLRVSGRFAAIISDGIADGSLRPVDPQIAADMLLGAIHLIPDLRGTMPYLEPASAFTLCAGSLLRGRDDGD